MQAPESHGKGRAPDWGTIVFGVLILVIGAYLLLKDTLGLDFLQVKGDAVWPLILIAVGAVVLLRTLAGDGRRAGPGR